MKNKKQISEYIGLIFDKYKYPVLAFAVGLLLVFGDGLFFDGKEKTASKKDMTDLEQTELDVLRALEKIEGVGKAEIVITIKSSSYNVFAKDSKYGKEGEEIVVISEGGSQKPLVEYTKAPSFQGAVIVCEGGENSRIKLAITNAVKALTGISSENIIILKMKG